jgi:antibiotic biosynthesis monooxygenase (ABM) superfamily enzyme
MLLQKKFHLVFSLVMGTFMTSFMTFVITIINVGFGPHFLAMWGRAFVIALVVAVPVIYFVAPLARKVTERLLNYDKLI